MQNDTSRTLAAAQVAGGCVVGCFSIQAVLVDQHNNYNYGLSINEDAGTVFALAAIMIAVLPVMAQIYPASKRYLRFATVFCLLVTIWAAFNAYSGELGADILAKDGQAKAYAGAVKDEDAARATLERIKETADAETLESMVSAAKTKADTAQATDTQKMGGKKDEVHCFKTCREAKDAHIALMGRLADAKARDEARKLLDKAKAEAKDGPAEASGAATWIAAQTGGDATAIARNLSIAETVALILGTQIIALLGHVAVSMIGSGLRVFFPAIERVEAPAADPAIEAAIPAEVSDKDAAYNWLIGQIQKAPERKLSVSGNKLAKTLGVPPATFANWVNAWIDEGKLVRERTGNKTTFTVSKTTKVRRAA